MSILADHAVQYCAQCLHKITFLSTLIIFKRVQSDYTQNIWEHSNQTKHFESQHVTTILGEGSMHKKAGYTQCRFYMCALHSSFAVFEYTLKVCHFCGILFFSSQKTCYQAMHNWAQHSLKGFTILQPILMTWGLSN